MKNSFDAIRSAVSILILAAALAISPAISGSAQSSNPPAAITTGDFDEDGVPDLVIANASNGGGGMIRLRRGSSAANEPFLSATVAAVAPVPVNFIGAGDFDADGHLDLAMARRGSEGLMWWRGDGLGNLEFQPLIQTKGSVTAFHVGEVNRADGLADIAVGVAGSNGARLLFYEGAEGALKRQPESFALAQLATGIAAGHLDGDWMMDIAVAAGEKLLLIHGRDRKLSLDLTSQKHVDRPVMTNTTCPPGFNHWPLAISLEPSERR